MVHKIWNGAIALGLALGAGLPARADNVPYNIPVKRAVIDAAAMLDDEFRRARFDLAATRQSGVAPRFFLDRLPRDLSALRDKARQDAFIRILLPLAAKANEIIARQRDRYLAIAHAEATGGFLTRNERDWLAACAGLYGARPTETDKVARRIDVVPPSLVIAHAIQASDWGADAPAVERNALFGDAGDAAYPSLLNAVMAHIHQVNTQLRFAEFRRQRALARMSGRALSGPALADAFKAGAAAPGDALAMLMRRHDLAALDSATLPRNTGATLVALVRTEPVPQAAKEDVDESLYPNLFFDPDRQDPSDRFAEPLPDGKYEELPR